MENDINAILRDSTEYAVQNGSVSREFVKCHAQELDDEVIDEHISIYVNNFTIDIGDKGKTAVNKLEEMARCKGIIKPDS